MNKVTLSVAALAAISVPVQMQAADDLTDEQKAELIKAKKATIDAIRVDLNAAINHIESNDVNVKEEYIKQLSQVALQLNKIYDDDTDLEISEDEVNTFKANIENIKIAADKAQAISVKVGVLNGNLTALEKAYDDALTSLDSYPAVKVSKEAALKALGVEAIGEAVGALNVDAADIESQIAELEAQIASANSIITSLMQNIAKENEDAVSIAAAHAQVEVAYTETAASVDAQVQAAIASLPAPYEDWQNEAIAKIRELGRVAQLAYNSDKAPNQNDPAKSQEYLNKINAAKGELETVVNGYVAKKAVEDKANNTAVADVEYLKGKLNNVVDALGDLTDCNDAVNKVKADIEALAGDIKAQYEAHTVSSFNYAGTKTDIENAIKGISDEKGNGYEFVIANKVAYDAMTTAIAGVKTSNETALESGKTASVDGKYIANETAGFTADAAAITEAIAKLEADAKLYYEAKTAEANAETFKTAKAAVDKKITAYNTNAAAALASYNTAVGKVTAAEPLLAKLEETATNTNVTIDGEIGSETYATRIAAIKGQISAINTAVENALKAAKGADQKSQLAAAADKTIDETIESLESNYKQNATHFEMNSAIKLADAVLGSNTPLVEELEGLLNGVTGDFGNQADAVNESKQALVKELNGIKTEIENAENEYKATKKTKPVDEDMIAAANTLLEQIDAAKTKLEDLKPKVEELSGKALAAVANKTAYDNVTAAITAANTTMTDVLDNTITPLDHSAAFEFYRNTMKDYKAALDAVETETETAYGAYNIAEKESDLTGRANAIKNNAKTFADAVLANENKFADQASDAAILLDKWNDVNNRISNEDLSDAAAGYLVELAKLKERIITLKDTTIPEAYAAGKSVAQETSIEAERKAIEAEIERIAKESKDNYDANVDATNKAQHENFLATYETAKAAFSEAIKTLNAFSSIKNGALQTALDNLIETHDDIYAYADKLRNLKAEEDVEYTKYQNDVTDGVDDIYSAYDYVNEANEYTNEIKALIEGYQNTVNAKAKELLEKTLDNAKEAVASKKEEIKNFVYDGKANAFEDVDNVIAEAEKVGNATDELGNIIDKDYAINVDTWMVTLDTELYTKLNNDITKACQAEYDKLHGDAVKVYNDEKSKIEKFAYIDNAAYLQELADLKASTIDYAERNFWTSVYSIENYVRPAIAQYFGTDENTKNSDVYQRASNESAESTANLEAYGKIDNALNLLVSDFNDVVATIKTVIVAHQAGAVNAKIAEIERALDAQRTDIEAWKEAGSCDENEETFNSFLSEKNRAGYPQMVDALKTLTVQDEVVVLNSIIDEVKEEYNQVAKKDLDLVKDYDIKIAKLYTDVLAIQDKYENSEVDIFEGTCSAFVAQEAAIAKINSELNAMYENTQVADAKAAVDAAIESISGPLAQAEEWANYNAATLAIAGEEIQGLRGEYELIKADYEAKAEDGRILIYKDQLLYDLDNVAKAIPGWGSALYNEYNKQLTNDNVYSQLSTQLTNYSSSLEAAYERINGFTHRNKINGQDIINNTYSNLKKLIEKYGEQLEKDHNDVKLSSWGELNNKINGLNNSIYDMEKNACTFEADGALYDIQASVDASLAIKSKSHYGGNRAAQLQADANEIGKLAVSALAFNADAQDNNISNDIDGNDVRIKYEYGEYVYYNDIYINYLEESYNGPSAWSILSERIAQLKADAEQLANDVVELAYIVGDADNDKVVTVNDYSEVRSWILNATKFEEVSEAKRYAGDVDGDEKFSVADMTKISNIIFYGKPDGEAAAASRGARAVANEGDEITLSKESEETSIFGKTVRIAVNVAHSEEFTAGQFDVVLPEGMKLAGASLTGRANGHELMSSELGDGVYRVVAATVENEMFNGKSGALVVLDVEVAGSYNGGGITISNAAFSNARGTLFTVAVPGAGTGNATGIDSITAPTVKERIYSIGGQIQKTVRKGLNILVGEDGKGKTVVK